MHRVAMSGKYNDSLAVIGREWSIPDVLDACELLASIYDACAAAEEKRRKQHG